MLCGFSGADAARQTGCAGWRVVGGGAGAGLLAVVTGSGGKIAWINLPPYNILYDLGRYTAREFAHKPLYRRRIIPVELMN